jgi:hypothetical protein
MDSFTLLLPLFHPHLCTTGSTYSVAPPSARWCSMLGTNTIVLSVWLSPAPIEVRQRHPCPACACLLRVTAQSRGSAASAMRTPPTSSRSKRFLLPRLGRHTLMNTCQYGCSRKGRKRREKSFREPFCGRHHAAREGHCCSCCQ